MSSQRKTLKNSDRITLMRIKYPRQKRIFTVTISRLHYQSISTNSRCLWTLVMIRSPPFRPVVYRTISATTQTAWLALLYALVPPVFGWAAKHSPGPKFVLINRTVYDFPVHKCLRVVPVFGGRLHSHLLDMGLIYYVRVCLRLWVWVCVRESVSQIKPAKRQM